VEYRRRFSVRFGDIDQARILYFPRLYEYFHEAFEEFWRDEAGRRYAQVLAEDGVGYPTVHVESDFRHPLLYGDDFEVGLRVERVGERSVTWLYRVWRAGEVIMESRITTACIDMETFRSCPVPEEHRVVLARFGAE